MADTSLIRHLIAKVSMDTADFTAGSKKAKAEAKALEAHLTKVSDSRAGIAALTAKIYGLNAEIARVSDRMGRVGMAMRDLFEKPKLTGLQTQLTELKKQRAELQAIVSLENSRRAGMNQWMKAQQSSISGAIAAAGVHEANAPAIAPEVGMFQGAGVGSVFADIKRVSTLVKGGGVFLGITQLTHSIRNMKTAMDEFDSSTLKAEAALRRLPGVGLIMEAAYSISGQDPEEEYRAAQIAFAKKQEYIMRSIQTRDDMEARSQEIRDDMRIRELEGYDRQIAEIKRETEARLEAIRVNQDSLQWQKDAASEMERLNEKSLIAEVNLKRNNEEIELNNALLQTNVKKMREQEEAMESAVDAYEDFLDSLKKLNDEFEASGFQLHPNDRRARKPEKNPFATKLEAQNLYDSTRTKKERLQDDLERWMELYNSGELSGDVLARAIAARTNHRNFQVGLPDLALRGTQAAESMISRQSVGKTEKTQDMILKEIMQMVRESQNSTDLLRRIEKKLGGVDLS